MHVLLTSTDNPYITQLGGKHIHLLLLERGLEQLDLDVTTLYYNRKSLFEIGKRGISALFPTKSRFELRLGWMISYLKKRIPEKELDIIHAHDVVSMLATAGTRQKKVLTLHGYFARENIEFVKNEKDRQSVYPFLLQFEKDGLKQADHVITVDQRLKEYVASELKYPEDRVSVLHNAVDTDQFTPALKEKQNALKKSAGFDPSDFVILVPRRLVEKNGVIYAVRAMKQMDGESIKMIIAGDGPERQKIGEEAGDDSRIHFLGMIPHERIGPYYSMADVIVIPSITSHDVQEASSLAMLEAMACGKVSICSDIGGMREIVQNKKNGLLVEEKSPHDIADAIGYLMENPHLKTEIGHAAREYVVKNHSYIDHAKNVAEIYHALLEE